LLLFQSLFKGFLPGKAKAMPVTTSRVGMSTTVVYPSHKADTLHIRDDSYRHLKHVVIPALQPRFNGRGVRGPLVTRAFLVAQPTKYSVQTQTVVLSTARYKMAEFVIHNNVIT